MFIHFLKQLWVLLYKKKCIIRNIYDINGEINDILSGISLNVKDILNLKKKTFKL